jgi:putative transcriptional regulator
MRSGKTHIGKIVKVTGMHVHLQIRADGKAKSARLSSLRSYCRSCCSIYSPSLTVFHRHGVHLATTWSQIAGISFSQEKVDEVRGEELGLAVGVSRQTITSLEAGKYTASLVLAYKIDKYFGLTIEEEFDFRETEEL